MANFIRWSCLMVFIVFTHHVNAQNQYAGNDKFICKGGSATIGAPPVGTYCYSWSPEAGLDDPKSSMPTAQPNATTTYTVKVFASSTNPGSSTNPAIAVETVTVWVAEMDLQIFKPSIIAGNDITQVDDALELSLGAMTFENLDNDDGDAEFDINDFDIPGGDNELIRLRILVTPNLPEYQVVKVIVPPGSNVSAIKIWNTKDKSGGEYIIGNDITLAMNGSNWEGELWVEGVNFHTSQQETILELQRAGIQDPNSACTDQVAITIAGVESLVWEGQGNGYDPASGHTSNTLDTNDPNFLVGGAPPANSDGTPILSYRVFPDARFDPGDPVNSINTPRDMVKLKVKLTVDPIEPISLFVKSFDIDDPITDVSVPLPGGSSVKFIDPNDDGGSGNYYSTSIPYSPSEDNRGSVNSQKFGEWSLNVDPIDPSITIVDFGINTIEKVAEFRVSQFPGDNYRSLAGFDRDFFPQTRNVDQFDGLSVMESGVGGEVLSPSKYLSHVLTVWRILHVEYDAMESSYTWWYDNGGNFAEVGRLSDVEGPLVSGKIQGTSVSKITTSNSLITHGSYDDYSPRLDGPLPHDNGRFENGTLVLGIDLTNFIPLPNAITIGPTTPTSPSTSNIKGNESKKIHFKINQDIISGFSCEVIDALGNPYTGTVNQFFKDPISGTYEWEVNLTGVNVSNCGAINFAGGTISIMGSPPEVITGTSSTGNVTVYNPVMSDPGATTGPAYVSGDTDLDGLLDVCETWVYTATHTVTLADLINGSYTNTATGMGSADTNGDGVGDTPVMDGDTETINAAQDPSIEVTKTSTTVPNTYNMVGDVLTYEMTLSNTGNVAVVYNPVMSDPGATTGPAYVSGDTDTDGLLDVGETWVYTATHTVTPADLTTGSYTNTATGTGSADTNGDGVGDTPVMDDDTETVNAAQNPSIEVTITSTTMPNTYSMVGDVLTYEMTLTNNSDVTVDNLLQTSSIVGIPFLLKDEDRNAPSLLSNAPSDLANLGVFQDAYLIHQLDGGGQISNNQSNLQFIGVLPTTFALDWPNIEGSRGSKYSESDLFWVVYICHAWQAFFHDGDPNLKDTLLWGATLTIPGCTFNNTSNVSLSQGLEATMVLGETIFDIPPPINTPLIIAHEVGHQFGLDHGTLEIDQNGDGCLETEYTSSHDPGISPIEFSAWGLMTSGSYTMSSTSFIPRHIHFIRSRVKSPGQN